MGILGHAWAGILVIALLGAAVPGMASAAQPSNSSIILVHGVDMLVRSSQCATISNLSQASPVQNATVFGYPFTVSEEMVLPNETRASINGVPYTINATNPAIITAGSAQFNVSMYGFSHSPTLQWVTLRMCGKLFTPIIPVHVMQSFKSAVPYSGAFNVSYYRSANITLSRVGLSILVTSNSMDNRTASVSVSLFSANAAASGYRLVNVYSVHVDAPSNVSASVSDSYPCSVNASLLRPFIYSGQGWAADNSFAADRNSCTVSFTLPADASALALYYAIQEPHASSQNRSISVGTFSAAQPIASASHAHNASMASSMLSPAQPTWYGGILNNIHSAQTLPQSSPAWLPSAYMIAIAAALAAVVTSYSYSASSRRRSPLHAKRASKYRDARSKLYKA